MRTRKRRWRTVCVDCNNQMEAPTVKAANWWAAYHAVTNQHTVEIWDAREWRP